jgi:hypothetical protein
MIPDHESPRAGLGCSEEGLVPDGVRVRIRVRGNANSPSTSTRGRSSPTCTRSPTSTATDDINRLSNHNHDSMTSFAIEGLIGHKTERKHGMHRNQKCDSSDNRVPSDDAIVIGESKRTRSSKLSPSPCMESTSSEHKLHHERRPQVQQPTPARRTNPFTSPNRNNNNRNNTIGSNVSTVSQLPPISPNRRLQRLSPHPNTPTQKQGHRHQYQSPSATPTGQTPLSPDVPVGCNQGQLMNSLSSFVDVYKDAVKAEQWRKRHVRSVSASRRRRSHSLDAGGERLGARSRSSSPSPPSASRSSSSIRAYQIEFGANFSPAAAHASCPEVINQKHKKNNNNSQLSESSREPFNLVQELGVPQNDDDDDMTMLTTLTSATMATTITLAACYENVLETISKFKRKQKKEEKVRKQDLHLHQRRHQIQDHHSHDYHHTTSRVSPPPFSSSSSSIQTLAENSSTATELSYVTTATTVNRPELDTYFAEAYIRNLSGTRRGSVCSATTQEQ